MDWQKNRLYIGVALLAVLGGGLYWGLSQREAANAAPSDAETPSLPELDKEAITELEITRPEHETIHLVKTDDTWRMTAPVESAVDDSAVSTALDKLAGLEVKRVAATNPENHERLEVDDAHGIHVVAHAGETTLDLLIGSYRGGNTMVRTPDSDTVLAVEGSIKYAFNKDPKDFRDRRVVDVTPSEVADIQYTASEHSFHFVKAGDDWVQAEGETPIERFGSSKVQSAVGSFARMRAVDFAPAEVTAEAAGIGEGSATVSFTVRHQPPTPDGGTAPPPTEETITLRLGNATPTNDQQFYVQRAGNPLIYVVSKFLADRMHPDESAFQAPEPGSEPSPSAMAPMPAGPGPGGPGGGQIPPELMQQIQRQLQQQAATMH